MRRSRAIDLKKQLMTEDLWQGIAAPSAAAFSDRRARGVRARQPQVQLAIGVTGTEQNSQLAVRVQELAPGLDIVLDRIRRRAKGAVEERRVGNVSKQKPWHKKRNRPLRIGGSIGHVEITAGTLGCFVQRSGEEFVLSNNHVLANENNADAGDDIIQAADSDGGRAPGDVIGKLARFVRLKQSKNLVDAATASLVEGIEYHYNWLETLGEIRGVRSDPPEPGEIVYKVGRTTGVTKGRVSAIEVDGLRVEYDSGIMSFDQQFEIEPFGNAPFSLGGDSGSLIVDGRRRALGLLFAGNDIDATYANPIGEVLKQLRAELVF